MNKKLRLHVKRKNVGTAVCKVKLMKSPIGHKPRGYRIIAVVPNKDHYNYQQEVYQTSFREKYIIAWMGDFESHPNQRILDAFVHGLRRAPLSVHHVNWE